MDTIELKIKSVEIIENSEDYVYDLVMEDEQFPFFFANDILVHNSCYFLTYAESNEDALFVGRYIQKAINKEFLDFAFCKESIISSLLSASFVL